MSRHMLDASNDHDKKEQLTTVSSSSRYRILSLIDNFIEQIFQIRKTLLGVSISALVLAPIAIGLSVFLLQHPSFFAILDIENEFGDVLAVLLGTIIIISSIWLVAGIRQYRLISSWKKRYGDYIIEKQEMDRKIASQYSGEDSITSSSSDC
ncbi:MAG TPA: hypothetical protein VFJ05_02925 [Nitrososphaeraceae archaeon]|nr:hypothetical protein [Nitrososphaeraceae archaeon]